MSDEGAAWMIEGLPNAENLGYPVGADVPRSLPAGFGAVVEVPAYVDLPSNTFAYSGQMPRPHVEEVTRAGRPYRRFTFPPLAHRNYDRWASFFTHWVPRPAPADRKDPGVFAWHFVTPQGPEAEQSLPIKLLPPLPAAAMPKRLQIRLWQSSIESVEPARLPEVLTLLQRAGFNQIAHWESTEANLRKAGIHEMGLRIAADQSGHAGWPDMAKPAPVPEYQNHDCEGKPLPDQDLQWVLDQNGDPWKNDLAYCRRHAATLDVISQDVEWNIDAYRAGFSPAGIRAFAREFGLDAAGLTPQAIWKTHRRQWGDFRAGQLLRLAALYHRAAKEGNPKVTTVFLPGSPYATTDADTMSDMVRLGPDNLGRMVYLPFPFPRARMQEAFDVLMPMWYGHGIGQVREAFSWSRAIAPAVKVPLTPLFLGQGREFYYPGGDPGEVLRAMAWAAVLGGSKGYGYWLGELSPLQLHWLARANRELARVEGLLLDGRPDPADVRVTPLPKKRFTLIRGKDKRVFPVPDFANVAVWRALAQGNRRLVGLINLDLAVDAWCRVSVAGLPAGNYRVLDVSENRLLCPRAGGNAFSARQVQEGFPVFAPAGYGVRALLIAPAGELPPAGLGKDPAPAREAAYRKYREPDTQGAELAARGGLSIRYDIVGKETAILIESPAQQVWVRPQSGGVISDWRIKEGGRVLAAPQSQYHGAAVDLFWSPADAHWSGDEKAAYEVVSAKVHGSKAYLTLRQAKRAPALGGLVLTKSIVVPQEGTDVQVRVRIENPGPAPEVGFSYWAHQMLLVGADAPEFPRIFMQGERGATEAPLAEVVWCKPGAPPLPGNEQWEKGQRNGSTTGDWIAQRDPATGAAVLCQSDTPVVQFYSWRDASRKQDLSLEWMYPYTKLEAGRSWSASYTLRYLKSVKPEDLPRRLLAPVP